MSSKIFLNAYSEAYVRSLTRSRTGESKIGDLVAVAGKNWQQSLAGHQGPYVLVGIPEDIGVRANLGRPGAHSAFTPALSAFLNQYHNQFFDSAQLLVLGEVECRDLMKKASRITARLEQSLRKLRDLVAILDERVAHVVQLIAQSGKMPLVIGGGHNNAYGIIKGMALAGKKPLNVINCDPHLDFRALEGRHSGNSFSYAFEEGLLGKYSVMAMHEQYNNSFALSAFARHPDRLWYRSFESVFVREEITFNAALQGCIGFVKDGGCGIEIDIDAVTSMPSSARTSSGISPLKARQYIHSCASALDCVYLHIAEGAPVLSHIRADRKTGKFIAYLLTDFIKAREQKMRGTED